MPTLRFSAPAVVFDEHDEVVEDPEVLRSLDGIESDEVFSDYMSDGGDRTLSNAGVSGGRLRFFFDDGAKLLIGVTEYQLERELTLEEQALLAEYTSGQWSDGIGENFAQERTESGLSVQLLVLENSELHVEKQA
ncbi:hypothetical protein ACEN9F_03675 [Duganella sp. CT11-25]|jgi:hypothetical protein|uniref:hypothetical protein n=1 Tax=unclassified Duganella TaxID=2636909 RepID=UPI0039B0B595